MSEKNGHYHCDVCGDYLSDGTRGGHADVCADCWLESYSYEQRLTAMLNAHGVPGENLDSINRVLWILTQLQNGKSN